MKKRLIGKRQQANFEKRFGNRITAVYADEPSDRHHNEEISSAIEDVLTGILGRTPTRREILGIDKISEE